MRLGLALREALHEGYNKQKFLSDVGAGIVVGSVAIPLAMALAIACGVAPQYGLYTAIIAGSVTALLGGSRYQVTGPTSSFVVLLFPIVHNFGLSGLLIAGMLSGFLLILFGVMKLGDVIQFIPHPVTTGFTSAIALVIGTLQLRDFFGLEALTESPHFLGRVREIALSIDTISISETSVGIATLLLLALGTKKISRFPVPILALTAVTAATFLIHYFYPEINFVTIGSRFQGIPQSLPVAVLPWSGFEFSLDAAQSLISSAFAIAMLGAIETLLTATIADGITGEKHSSDVELVALGISNVLCPFFSGIPAVGAVARTTTNIRCGAVTPLASVFHSLTVLLVLVSFAPLVNSIPLASMAALLMFVAYHMAERAHFTNILRIGTREDKVVLMVCFLLTVIFNMTIGVGIGVVLAALLFVRRLANMTKGQILKNFNPVKGNPIPNLPPSVFYYKISGAMFFGAAQRAISSIGQLSKDVRFVILDLAEVPILDVTGLVALDSAIKTMLLRKQKIGLVVHPGANRLQICQMSTLCEPCREILICDTADQAVEEALKNI